MKFTMTSMVVMGLMGVGLAAGEADPLGHLNNMDLNDLLDAKLDESFLHKKNGAARRHLQEDESAESMESMETSAPTAAPTPSPTGVDGEKGIAPGGGSGGGGGGSGGGEDGEDTDDMDSMDGMDGERGFDASFAPTSAPTAAPTGALDRDLVISGAPSRQSSATVATALALAGTVAALAVSMA